MAEKCNCELRDRQWNPFTKKCETKKHFASESPLGGEGK